MNKSEVISEYSWDGPFGFTYRAWIDDPRFPKAERRHPKMPGPVAPMIPELAAQILRLATREKALRESLADLVNRFSGVARLHADTVLGSDLTAIQAARNLLEGGE